MAITFTGYKTCAVKLAPHLTTTVLNALMSTAPENYTIAQVNQLKDVLDRVAGGHAPDKTVGSLLV